MIKEFNANLDAIRGGISTEFIYAELSLWGHPPTIGVDIREAISRMDMLGLVSEHDESYHDYFAVGLKDIEFIEKCIAEGIDASLAVSAVGDD